MSDYLSRIATTGLVTLVGADTAQIDQNKYTPSVAVPIELGLASKGIVIRTIRILVGESGDGAVIKTVGDFVIFNADPVIAANDSAIGSVAKWATVVGRVTFAAGAYGTGDANGNVAEIQTNIFIPDWSDTSQGGYRRLWVAILKTDAAALNDTAANNEFIQVELIYT